MINFTESHNLFISPDGYVCMPYKTQANNIGYKKYSKCNYIYLTKPNTMSHRDLNFQYNFAKKKQTLQHQIRTTIIYSQTLLFKTSQNKKRHI